MWQEACEYDSEVLQVQSNDSPSEDKQLYNSYNSSFFCFLFWFDSLKDWAIEIGYALIVVWLYLRISNALLIFNLELQQ